MRGQIFLRFFMASVACALSIGVLALIALRALSENTSGEFRRHGVLSLAQHFETGGVPKELEESLPGPPPHDDRPRPPYPHGRPPYPHGRPPFHGKIWVVSADGKIISSNSADPLPEQWSSIPKPDSIHNMTVTYHLFGFLPSLTLVRLNTETPTYLVVTQPGNRAHKREWLQIVLFGLALAFSILVSMMMTSYYLRRKSREAREVLLRLERGDLKARFQIRQFDEMGNLMLDFNRMASEIERLVGRLTETEQARKNLFQELSHDLRTPLTSLRGSIDTLAHHFEEMPHEHRKQVIGVCQTEMTYFMELLESLLFIAQMDEPRYKKDVTSVSLGDLLEQEIGARKTQERTVAGKINWKFSVTAKEKRVAIPGDAHLIRRLIKNALDNAARFATREVVVELGLREGQAFLQIKDDGPGISEDDIIQFGKLRNRRVVANGGESHISLGLGSVIMMKILALHGGSLRIRRDGGTVLELQFPG